jgi:hypothetical protein
MTKTIFPNNDNGIAGQNSTYAGKIERTEASND